MAWQRKELPRKAGSAARVAPAAREQRGPVHGPATCAFISAALLAFGAPPAFAEVTISVNKSTQHMTVSLDGVPRYDFVVSTGRAGYGTPSGTYHPQRMERTWFSREYYNSPMPYSIFFHGGFAIHGSYEINRLGGPASHGCIRLHPSNAATLFSLVKNEGMDATTIVVSGEYAGAETSAPIPSRAAAPRRRSYERPYSGYGQPYQNYGQPYQNYGQPYQSYGQPYQPGYRWQGPNAFPY